MSWVAADIYSTTVSKTASVASNLTLNTRWEGIKEQYCAITLKKKRELVFVQTGILTKWLHKGRKIASQNSLREHNCSPSRRPPPPVQQDRSLSSKQDKEFRLTYLRVLAAGEQRAARPNLIKVYLITVAFDLHCCLLLRLAGVFWSRLSLHPAVI